MAETMNVNHVAIKEGVKCTWTFVLPSNARYCADEIEELSDICSQLFSTLDNFVVPLRANFSIQRYPRGSLIPVGDDGGPNGCIEQLERSVSDDDGIKVDSLIAAFHPNRSSDAYVQRVHIDRTKVNMRLEWGDGLVDRYAHSVRYNVDTPLDRPPSYDPLYFEIAHLPNVDVVDTDSDFLFVVRVNTKTDIWFEDTEIGRVNRERLTALLRRIDTTLSTKKLIRRTDWDNTDPLKEIY